MDEVKINTSKTLTLTLPSDPDSNIVNVSLYHEFGDLVNGPVQATRTALGTYQITFGSDAAGIFVLNSSGKYRADFIYSISGTSYKKSQYFNVSTPYVSSAEFFIQYPELETGNSAKFDAVEKRVRAIIDTYCGQSFEAYTSKTLSLNGNNSKTLHLPFPISTLTKVVMNKGESDETLIHDVATNLKTLEKVRQPFNFESTYYIRFKGIDTTTAEGRFIDTRFRETDSYFITGDWGWPYIPTNVTEASKLLIADVMNDDSEYYRHRVTSVDLDTTSFTMKSNFYETTGNIEADVLLTDYTLFVMDYIR